MKIIVAAVFLSVISSGQGLGKAQAPEFLSWYDGWGVHTVWGAGRIRGTYKGAQVACGDIMVSVSAIHDSHETDGNPLSPEQTAEHAKTRNLELLRSLERQEVTCAFEQASAAEA